MTSRFDADRLWDLPRVESHDDGPVPPDALLAAYRTGALSPEESTRLEWRLAGSRRGRERLAAIAGVRLDAPGAPRPRRRMLVAALLAAAAAAAIAAFLFIGRGSPTLPDFSVRVEGLASVRGVPGDARAYPSQRVRIVVEPQGDAVPSLTFAAYRLVPGGLTRLDEATEVTIAADRGSASLVAEAARLIGPEDGTRPCFVVVSNRSRLPDRVIAPVEAPESALSEATGGRVYRVSLTIVPRTESLP